MAVRATRAAARRWEDDELSARVRTPASELPPADVMVRNLTRSVLEVLAGVRDVHQIARWMTEDAFRALATRSALAARARSARGVPSMRPVHRILSTHCTYPCDDVVEAVVVIAGPSRTRAVAIRLEGMDHRWRAASLALL